MDIEKYMDLMSESSESIDEDYYSVEVEYEKRFGHIIPTEMLPPNISFEQIKEAMIISIERNKDVADEYLKRCNINW